MKYCQNCLKILREELRPKLVQSGQSKLRMKCPVCDRFFPSDEEEMEAKKKKQAGGSWGRMDQFWKNLKGNPHKYPTP